MRWRVAELVYHARDIKPKKSYEGSVPVFGSMKSPSSSGSRTDMKASTGVGAATPQRVATATRLTVNLLPLAVTSIRSACAQARARAWAVPARS